MRIYTAEICKEIQRIKVFFFQISKLQYLPIFRKRANGFCCEPDKLRVTGNFNNSPFNNFINTFILDILKEMAKITFLC